MSRPRGSKNKTKATLVEQFNLTTEQRIKLVANLVVEKIIEDNDFAHKLAGLFEDKKDVSN